MIDDVQIRRNREEIELALRATGREGMDEVLRFLDEGGFYETPSSDRNHHNWRGGLAQHALEVMHNAREAYPKLPADSVTIAALLHDVCKVGRFRINPDGHITRLPSADDGHGSRSLRILRDLVQMFPEEERAIRYHMRSMRPHPDDSPGLEEARRDSLWWAIHKSDAFSAKTNGHYT